MFLEHSNCLSELNKPQDWIVSFKRSNLHIASHFFFEVILKLCEGPVMLDRAFHISSHDHKEAKDRRMCDSWNHMVRSAPILPFVHKNSSFWVGFPWRDYWNFDLNGQQIEPQPYNGLLHRKEYSLSIVLHPVISCQVCLCCTYMTHAPTLGV